MNKFCSIVGVIGTCLCERPRNLFPSSATPMKRHFFLADVLLGSQTTEFGGP